MTCWTANAVVDSQTCVKMLGEWSNENKTRCVALLLLQDNKLGEVSQSLPLGLAKNLGIDVTSVVADVVH